MTGGLRAYQSGRNLWSWYPVLSNAGLEQLTPQPINMIAERAMGLGQTLFGGDVHSGLEKSLPSRIWTPIDDPNSGEMQAADLWRGISHNAIAAEDSRYSELSSYIAFSLTAASVRLRDASDHYHSQLLLAVEDNRQPGDRFSNVPMLDIQIAFHSVLSELASARDYLAALIAYTLGAPGKIDAMNRLVDWLSQSAQSEHGSHPIVQAIANARDRDGSDPWLYHLTEYRNQALHKRPFGQSSAARWLVYNVMATEGFAVPFISLPVDQSPLETTVGEALHQFVYLFRKMNHFLRLCASKSKYPSTPPTFVVQ